MHTLQAALSEIENQLGYDLKTMESECGTRENGFYIRLFKGEFELVFSRGCTTPYMLTYTGEGHYINIKGNTVEEILIEYMEKVC